MVFCDSQFDQFDEKLKLNATRIERIESALNEFTRLCESDSQLKSALACTPFFQGSYSIDTVIKPLYGDEYDIDLIYPFSLNVFDTQYRNPSAVVNWFLERLRQNPRYADKLQPMPRCARIDYAGDFHLDIIPATIDVKTHQPYAVPSRDLKDWKKNDPDGMTNWVSNLSKRSKEKDAYGIERFRRAIRLFKRWRDLHFSSNNAPSSILLLTMLGKHEPSINYNPPLDYPLYPQYSHDAAYIYDMARLTHSCIQRAGSQSFIHPTIINDNLADDWQNNHLEFFMTKLTNLIEKLRQAIWSEQQTNALSYYREVFGADFPAF